MVLAKFFGVYTWACIPSLIASPNSKSHVGLALTRWSCTNFSVSLDKNVPSLSTSTCSVLFYHRPKSQSCGSPPPPQLEKFKFFLGPGQSALNTNTFRNNEQAFLWGYWTLSRSIIVQGSSIFTQDGHSHWSLGAGGVSVSSVCLKRDEVICHLVDWKLI